MKQCRAEEAECESIISSKHLKGPRTKTIQSWHVNGQSTKTIQSWHVKSPRIKTIQSSYVKGPSTKTSIKTSEGPCRANTLEYEMNEKGGNVGITGAVF